ncbi:MAG: gamma carbonic anhydrase family protein [Oligoflexia bacterium]|nr:gamma carbonic anhydrase family protein [Oligoflexia bacterium]
MILPHHGHWPRVHETAFVAPSADVIGEVEIGAHSSIWFQCVVRGDVNAIRIGARTNIQDHSMLHVTRKVSLLTIGDEVTVGHRASLHGCTIGNRVLVGMGAIVLDDAVIGDECIIGAGALVTQGTRIPSRSLVLGAPARVIRALRPEELASLEKSAANYVADAMEYYSYVRGPVRLDADHRDLHGELSDFENLKGEER